MQFPHDSWRDEEWVVLEAHVEQVEDVIDMLPDESEWIEFFEGHVRLLDAVVNLWRPRSRLAPFDPPPGTVDAELAGLDLEWGRVDGEWRLR